MRSLLLIAALATAAGFTAPGAGQDKKKPKTEPRVLLAVPFAATPGKTIKLTLRGHHLDQTKEVKVGAGAGSAKVLGKGKSEPPDKLPPEKFGDTNLEVELKLNDKVSGDVTLTVVTAEGETKPYALLVDSKLPLVNDKEGNDGFREAQPLTLPAAVDGRIERQRDVDVFRFEGKAGQKIVAEVIAARRGSALDGMLTLYSADGNQVAVSDDGKDTFDPRLEATLPADGVYYLSLIDAHDTGGTLHLYRLTIK